MHNSPWLFELSAQLTVHLHACSSTHSIPVRNGTHHSLPASLRLVSYHDAKQLRMRTHSTDANLITARHVPAPSKSSMVRKPVLSTLVLTSLQGVRGCSHPPARRTSMTSVQRKSHRKPTKKTTTDIELRDSSGQAWRTPGTCPRSV